jgi:hypothetical protein
MSYDKQIKYSQHKVKTTWRIINNELLKKVNRDNIQILNMNGKKITHSYDIANFFLSVVLVRKRTIPTAACQ